MKIKLYTSYYQDSLPERHQENQTCLTNNINNPLIDEIFLFVEDTAEFENLKSNKIKLVKTRSERCTYKDFIEHANAQSEPFVLLMANTDIYFDQSLQLIKNADFDNQLYVVGRRELDLSGHSALTEHYHSSDAWILKTPIRDFFCDIRLGKLHCESYFLGFAQRAGYQIKSIGLSVAAYHLHITQKRNYDPNVDRYGDMESLVFPGLGSFKDHAPSSQSATNKTIAIDCNAFQLRKLTACRTWLGLLPELVAGKLGASLTLLDRGNTSPKIQGINLFNAGFFNTTLAVGSRYANQSICNELDAGIFISTFHSSPLNTKTILPIYDLIHETVNGDPEHLHSKNFALHQASKIVVFSKASAELLFRHYPFIRPDQVLLTRIGVSDLFRHSDQNRVNNFRDKYQIKGHYLLFIGERTGSSGYANAELVFKALAKTKALSELNILCVGGKFEMEPMLSSYLGTNRVKLLHLDDPELLDAYSGAFALIYPQVIPGMGFSVLEAMRCCCPVISARNPAIQEMHGELPVYYDVYNENSLLAAIEKLTNPDFRLKQIESAFKHSMEFSWREAATVITNAALQLSSEKPTVQQASELKYLP